MKTRIVRMDTSSSSYTYVCIYIYILDNRRPSVIGVSGPVRAFAAKSCQWRDRGSRKCWSKRSRAYILHEKWMCANIHDDDPEWIMIQRDLPNIMCIYIYKRVYKTSVAFLGFRWAPRRGLPVSTADFSSLFGRFCAAFFYVSTATRHRFFSIRLPRVYIHTRGRVWK